MGTIKFNNKQTMADKAKMAEGKYGKTTKGKAEKAKSSVKVNPTGSLKKPGVKATWKF